MSRGNLDKIWEFVKKFLFGTGVGVFGKSGGVWDRGIVPRFRGKGGLLSQGGCVDTLGVLGREVEGGDYFWMGKYFFGEAFS